MDIVLKYTLKKIQEQCLEVPNINYGGCCHFAKMVAKQLDKRNLKYRVTLLDSCLSLNSIKNAIINKENYILSCGHVALKINNIYYDSITLSKSIPKNNFSYNFKNYKLKSKHLVQFSNYADWNPSFNRRKYHPILNSIIINQFKIYDKLKNGNN